MAAFLLSVCRDPAVVERTVDGGMCCSPGPRVRVPFLDLGSWDCGISSPGRRTVVDAAMVGCIGLVWVSLEDAVGF